MALLPYEDRETGQVYRTPEEFTQYLRRKQQQSATSTPDESLSSDSSSGGWLPAPYNIIVEPHRTKDGKDEGGGSYEEARKKYAELRAKVIDTGEASNLRKAWGSTPQIELDNGKLTLKGSKEFLESPTAKQLRGVFEEMKGKTYNTEALDKQIEAWNADLQKMSDTYLSNLEGYNALNQLVASTYSMQGSDNSEFKPYTFSEYLKIANSMRLGKESNAANLDDLIFVGYEWDDDGNRKEKWVKAKDFYEEFNSIADKDKRKALHSLIIQSQNGDAGAASKLYYLTGGKDTPANVTYGATYRINDFFDTLTKNIYSGLAEAADFVTTYVPIFNTGRLTGRVVNAASEGGWNWDKFFEADDTRKMIDEYEDLVAWENAYRMELTPGSTQAAAITGSVIGGALGMAYSIWAGGVGNEAAVQGVSRAISSAGNALRQTGNFVEYTYTINVESGKLQLVRVMSNGAQLGTVPIGTAATGGSVSQSVLIPTALAEKFPNFAAKFAEVSAQVGARSKLMLQFGNMTEAGQNIARVTSTAGRGSILGAADIAKLRMQSRGLQTAINLYILGNESAIRHVDQYFRRTQEGEDLGDMGQYLIDNVGRDVIIGGAMYGAGMTIRGLKNIAKNSKIPASRNYEVYETMATNSQSGFYNAGSKYDVQPLMLGTGGPTIDTDVARTIGSIMTVNGEPFFVSPTTSGLVSSAVPGSELAGQAFGFVSNNKVNTVTVEPAVGGFNVVTTSIPNDGGTSVTTKSFYENLDEANLAAKKAGVPSVNAKTLANSDMALTGNVVPFSVDELSAIRYLPTGVSRVKFTPKISYLTPDEYMLEANDVVAGLAPDLRRAYEAALGPNISAEGIDAISQQIYAKDGPLLAAPRLFVPRTEAEAVELARGVGKAMAVKQMNPGSSPIVPVQTEPDDVEILKRRRVVKEVTYIGGYTNPYEATEYNPITLDRVALTGERNSWIANAPNGAMSFALGKRAESVNMEDIMTIKDIRKKYTSERKGKNFDDFLALSAMLNIIPTDSSHPTKVLVGMRLGEVMNVPEGIDNIEEGIFRNGVRKSGVTTYRIMTVADAIDEGVISEETIKNEMDFLRKVSTEKDELKYIDKYEKVMLKSLAKTKAWIAKAEKAAAEKNRNRDGELMDEMRELLDEAASIYKRVLRDGVAKSIQEKGTKIIHPIAVPAQIDTESKIAFFSPGNMELATRVQNGTENRDEGLLHLPKGTKIIGYEYRDKNGYTAREWAVDLSKGIISAGKTQDPDEGWYSAQDYYVNTPSGEKYIPKGLEYDPSAYMIHSSENRFDSYSYTQAGKDLLEPTNKVTGHLDGDYSDSIYGRVNMYELTKPSGPVNRLNKFLRKYGLIEDSLSNRWELIKREFDPGGRHTSDRFKQSHMTPAWITDAVRGLITPGSVVDNIDFMVDGTPLTEALARTRRSQDTIEAKFKRAVDDVLVDNVIAHLRENDRPSEEAWIVGRSRDSSYVLPQEVVDKTLAEVDALVAEYSDKLPSGYSSVLKEVAMYGNHGSHRVKGVPMVFHHRGVNSKGNSINRADTEIPFVNAMPGDHITTNDFMFGTFNAMTPFAYASDFDSSNGHGYVLTIGTPEGGELYYYGDENSDFNSRVHYNDGGAVVYPYASGMTVVSRVELSPDVTWITLIRDNPDGTPYSGPIDKDVAYLREEVTKKRKTVDVEKRTPRNIVVTENGLPRKWFSDMGEAIKYKDELGTRGIYKVDESQIILDRPPVTMDNIYYPAVRGANGVATIDEIDMGGVAPNTTDAIAKFNDAMASLPLLKEYPEDYAQGVLDVVQQVKTVYNEVSRFVDIDKTYEEYARQIAEGVEQPTVNDYAKETLEPLSNMLTALGKYFDPSGKSLTKEFYLPTGGKSTKLVSVEDAIAHPEKTVDVDAPVDASFDNILVDPLRVGSSGFWEKRTGELFLDEDGNFTMAKSGSLEENLIAYTVSALTRGENRLSVAANNEVARSKFDKNRNPITSKQALDGLKLADTYRARVRAAQLKNHKSLKDLFGNKELEKLKANYTDKEIVDAIDDAYKQKNFSKELNPVFRINEAAVELGYRQTLQISNLPGSGIREGLNSGFRGFSNLIRKAEHINVTGAKYVMRNNEYVCVGFGLPANMLSEYGAVVGEKAVNLGDTVNLLFNPSRAAVTMYEDIRNSQQQWLDNGGWEMMNKLESYATSYFPLISSPKYAAQRLASELGRNLDAYNDPQALWLANAASIESWVKRYAMENLNAAIQMSDISKIDERTTNTLNDIITTASVGTPVYSSNIVSFIQRTAYWATLWGNGSPLVGNLMSEPMRLIDYYGVKTFTKSFKGVISPKERARIKNIIGDLPSRFDDRPELVGLAAKAKSKLGTLFEFVETAGMTPLQKSEELKNLWFWKAAEINAKELFPNDKIKQVEHTLRMFNDTAITGGMGTNPSMATGSIGRLATVLKTFTIRNWDDFIEATERVGRGELGTRKWQRNRRSEDSTYNRYTSGNKQSFNKTAAFRFAGGSILRRYLLWLLVLGPLGRSIWDALGGDPTGLTENFSRGLYDDESTEYDEGMQPIDNFINMIPTGFILGTLKDIYFAARRAGVQTQNFLGIPDFEKDGRFQKDLRQHLPAGVVTRRLGDMLELMDRGYSTNSYGNKTYAAPESLADVFKGFLLGKSATTNAQAYNKYRYGSVDIWGDLFEGDWLDFAMSANPFASMGAVKFDSTRKDYTGVFRGGTNDIPTMQAAIADLRDRNKKIIDGYNKNLEAYTGEFQGLSTEDRKKLAIEKREKAIATFTEDVTRLVDAFEDAGHSLSDKQINTMMYLFDFNEGDEETSDYTIAQQRYVEAGLPDVSPAVQTAKEKNGKVETQNYFDRSLVYQNAVQGIYGAGRGAAKAVKETLNSFKDVYKEYKKAVGDLQDKVFKKGISASEKKQRSKELEKVQNEYLEKLYAELTPVIDKYGTSILSNNDVIKELQPYMSSMIPYSSIKKYGETFSSGNDIVWGQLSDWIQHRWGVGSPKEKSDQEVLDTINKIKALRNAGKVAQSKSEARALLERVARGSVKIRTKDLTTLRKLLNE